MSELNREIGSRIRGIRELSGWDAKTFAERARIDPTLLSQYERGETDIPVSALHAVAGACDISMTELLTGEKAKLSVYSVVRKGRGVGVERRKAYDYKSLAYNFSGRKMDPFLIAVEPKPEEEPVHMTAHSGHEFHYCLSGTVRLVIAKYEVLLREGDSVYFDSTYPHGVQAMGGAPAQMLVVITGKE